MFHWFLSLPSLKACQLVSTKSDKKVLCCKKVLRTHQFHVYRWIFVNDRFQMFPLVRNVQFYYNLIITDQAVYITHRHREPDFSFHKVIEKQKLERIDISLFSSIPLPPLGNGCQPQGHHAHDPIQPGL